MALPKIPDGYQAVMPYLILESATRFIDFTQKVFDSELRIKKFRDGGEVIMHAEISISGSVIMFCDTTDQWTSQTSNLFVYVANADVSYASALAEGASSVMEPADQDYGRSCGVMDTNGNVWWITSVK